MNKNNYNYTLNGISHEISLQSNIKIRVQPHHEKKLISNKYMIKFMNDLFEHYNIDYFLCGHTLLGHKLFEGVHLFSDKIELGIIKNNLVKLRKCEQFLIDNDFQIYFFEHFVLIETIFFENMKSYVLIYLIDDDKQLFLKNEKNETYLFDFYDIFPIKQIKYEEFTSYVPNKINSVLKIFQFQLKTIIFKKLYFVNYDFLLDPIKKQLGVQEEDAFNNSKHEEEIITWEQKKIKHNDTNQSTRNQNYGDDENDSDSSDEDYVNNIQQVLEMDNIIHKVIYEQQNNIEKDTLKNKEIIEQNMKENLPVQEIEKKIELEKLLKKETENFHPNQVIQEVVYENIKADAEFEVEVEVKAVDEIISKKNLNKILIENENVENDYNDESSFYSKIKEENIEFLVDDNEIYKIQQVHQIIITILFTCCYYFYLPKTE